MRSKSQFSTLIGPIFLIWASIQCLLAAKPLSGRSEGELVAEREFVRNRDREEGEADLSNGENQGRGESIYPSGVAGGLSPVPIAYRLRWCWDHQACSKPNVCKILFCFFFSFFELNCFVLFQWWYSILELLTCLHSVLLCN